MEDKTTSETTENKRTVDDVYNEIDQRVQTFAKDFLNFLPKNDTVAVNIQLIADRLLTIKESAKLLVNNFVISSDKESEENKEK